jgi:hypothetical protein
MSIVNLTFSNTLGRDVRIVLADFGYPDYILQRKFPDRWRDADAAIRIGLPTDSISLPNSSGLQRSIPLHPERIDAPYRVGTYRFRFKIVEWASNQLVAEEFCLSNEFQLINQ